MNLTEEHLKRLADFAIEAATRAGNYVSETRPTNVEHKGAGGSLATEVVTEVDRASQNMILEILKPSFAAFDLGLLTEESPDDGSRLEKDYFWCIDPIDGTLPFIEGVPGYAVSIALISRAGVPMIGAMHDPVENTLYHAVRGGGAFKNGSTWQPDLSDTATRLNIFSDRSEAKGPRFKPAAAALEADLAGTGGAVMNAIWCLENPPACYFKFSKTGVGGGCFWDFAATACLYHELGAVATDVAGKPLELNRAESIYLSHCGVLYATHPALARRFLDSNKEPHEK